MYKMGFYKSSLVDVFCVWVLLSIVSCSLDHDMLLEVLNSVKSTSLELLRYELNPLFTKVENVGGESKGSPHAKKSLFEATPKIAIHVDSLLLIEFT